MFTQQKNPYVKRRQSRFTFFVAKLTCAASRNLCGKKSLRCNGAPRCGEIWRQMFRIQLSNEKNPGCLGYIGDEILPSYIGIIINHYKDPY